MFTSQYTHKTIHSFPCNDVSLLDQFETIHVELRSSHSCAVKVVYLHHVTALLLDFMKHFHIRLRIRTPPHTLKVKAVSVLN